MDIAVKEIRGIMQDAGIVVGDTLPPEVQQVLTTLQGLCTSKKPAAAPTSGSDRHLELTRTAHAAEQRLQDEQAKLVALQTRRDRLEEEVQASTKAIERLRMKFEQAQADLVKDLQGQTGAAGPAAPAAAEATRSPASWSAYQAECDPVAMETAYNEHQAQELAKGLSPLDRAVWTARFMMEAAKKCFEQGEPSASNPRKRQATEEARAAGDDAY